MTPLFSIIIPAYNSEKFISNCIKSVLNQNFSKINYEIIVVNDGSKDKTLNICKNFNKKNVPLRILNNRRNCGVSYSRNIAIKYALGKFLVFIVYFGFILLMVLVLISIVVYLLCLMLYVL